MRMEKMIDRLKNTDSAPPQCIIISNDSVSRFVTWLG